MKKNPTLCAVVILACLFFSAPFSFADKPIQKRFGVDHPFEIEELPEGKLRTKLQSINPEARQKAMAWLHTMQFKEFDAKEHLRVDKDGGIFIICPDDHGNCDDGHSHGAAADESSATGEGEAAHAAESGAEAESESESESVIATAAVPVSNPPAYNSKPGAPNHIYLDFNGALVSGKEWSRDGVASWDCAAWGTDGDATTFSDSEQTEMRRVWERISEDYAPFNINVTTDVTYDSVNYTGDKNKVGWLLFTATTDKLGALCPHYGSGGVAYVGVFGNSNYFSEYQPAWVTPTSATNMAEAGSHEMGHNLGLSHDGTSDRPYYGGHNATSSAPSWGPIMGTGYGRNVSQWSKGEYYDANYFQDDLAIIAARVPYRADDHGETFTAATVWQDPDINQPGFVEKTDSPDYFTFTTGAGNITFNAAAYKSDTSTWGGNLDIQLELYDSSQTLIASNNPASGVNASISQTVAAGDYYVVLKPSAAGNPSDVSPSGYTNYGSLGQYTISGAIIPTIILTAPNGAENWIRGTTRTITWVSALGGNVKIELFNNGLLFSTIASSTPNDGSYDWAIPADHTLGSGYRIRISNTEDATTFDESLVDFSIVQKPAYYASMDIDPGWTFSDPSWAYGQPTGANQDGQGASDPTSGSNGPNVIGYRLDGDYEQLISATRWARTPAIDCSDYENVTLSFQRWLGVQRSLSDRAYIQVSTDGLNWTTVWENPDATVNDNSWTAMQYDISAVADRQPTVYIRWGMGATDALLHYSGWNIDEVLVDGNFVGEAYNTWSGNLVFTDDANNDGVSNGLAWALGAASPSADATEILPALINPDDPDFLIYSYRRSDEANAQATIICQYGSNLVNDWTTAIHDGTNVIITVSDDFHGSSPGIDKVEVKIRRSEAVGGKLFIRLRVTPDP
jgi:hypothetical protein